MKTLNLENLGVQELDTKEMREVDGGGGINGWYWIALKRDLSKSFKEFIDGFNDGSGANCK